MFVPFCFGKTEPKNRQTQILLYSLIVIINNTQEQLLPVGLKTSSCLFIVEITFICQEVLESDY